MVSQASEEVVVYVTRDLRCYSNTHLHPTGRGWVKAAIHVDRVVEMGGVLTRHQHHRAPAQKQVSVMIKADHVSWSVSL